MTGYQKNDIYNYLRHGLENYLTKRQQGGDFFDPVYAALGYNPNGKYSQQIDEKINNMKKMGMLEDLHKQKLELIKIKKQNLMKQCNCDDYDYDDYNESDECGKCDN